MNQKRVILAKSSHHGTGQRRLALARQWVRFALAPASL